MTITSVRGTPESDTDLAARFARETEPPFEVLLRGARRLTRSDADAEDLLQDTLLHAYAGFGTFQENSNLQAWLFRILYNRWVSTIAPSSAALWRFRSTTSPSATWPVAPHVPAASAEAEVLDALPDNDIRRRWPRCPKASGRGVLRRYPGIHLCRNRRDPDIPLGTVMSRVSRGRQRLRIALAHLALHLADPRNHSSRKPVTNNGIDLSDRVDHRRNRRNRPGLCEADGP